MYAVRAANERQNMAAAAAAAAGTWGDGVRDRACCEEADGLGGQVRAGGREGDRFFRHGAAVRGDSVPRRAAKRKESTAATSALCRHARRGPGCSTLGGVTSYGVTVGRR